MKTRMALAMLAIAWIAFTGGCKKDDYVEVIGKCPIVESTDPANNAVAVPLNQVITVTFNEKMNASSITTNSIVILGASQVQGTISYSGQTATFTPAAPLIANTTYTGRVTTAVKDLQGNKLQVDYVWSFSTGAIVAPMVISTDPLNLATGVVLNKQVQASFNMPMDPLTLNTSTVTLKLGTTVISGTVSYVDSTVTFSSTAPLIADTVYTATVTTGAKNLAAVSIASDYVWTFRTGATIAPYVISNVPLDQATGVPQNQVMTATFSEPMDPLTINTSTILLKQGTTVIPGTVSYSGSTATFTPTTNLTAGTVYSMTVTTGAKNPANVALANNHVWTFTTVSIPAPTVVSTDPANNATGVLRNKVITATFSEPMNAATIGNISFTVKQGLTPVSGTVSYSGLTASFVPTTLLAPGTVYTATISTVATSAAGVPLANNYVWTFTTLVLPPPNVISTDPVDLATNVPLVKVISATFSVPMDPLTITTSTFTLKKGSVAIPGVVNYSGNTATFTPNTYLESDTTYTATITNGVKDANNVSMVSNYVWHFNTVAHIGPSGVDLGSAGRFGILAGVGISNNAGFSEIHDLDVGISPGVRSSVTGFPPAIVVNGAIYCSDDLTPPGTAAMLTQAKSDLTAAYLFAEGATSPAPATVSGDQGGLTLAPGIYKSTSTLLIQSGDLTLDAQGDVNAVWIFQIASGFTTVGGSGGNVILIGGAQAKNVYWQTGTSATIGDNTIFRGNVLALTSITMNSNAVAYGRMLARNGSVVMTSTNFIYRP